MINFFTSPLFYLFLTFGVYSLFAFLAKKTKSALLNPLLWTSVFIVGYLILITAIDKTLTTENLKESALDYNNSVNIINILLSPITVCLALPVYMKRDVIKKHWLPILIGSIVGCAASMTSVFVLCKLFNISKDITFSLLPKGVTTAIAQEVSTILGVSNEVSITVSAVVITGILGAIFGPILTKLFKINDETAMGMAYGATSHVVGTSKAVEISEQTGAISSVAIVICGLITVLVSLVIILF